MLDRVLVVIDRINEWSGKAVSLLYLPLVVIILYSVVTRYAFHDAPLWSDETATFLWGIAWVMAGGYVLQVDRHVKMDLLLNRLAPRRRALMELLQFPLFLLFIGLLLWKGWETAAQSVSALEHSNSIWRPPIWPIKLVIPIGTFLFLLQGIAKFIRDFAIATGRK